MDKTHGSSSNYHDVEQLLTDYALVWPREESKEGCVNFFGSKAHEDAQEMTSAVVYKDDASKKMWEETKSEEKDKKKIVKEKVLFGRAGRMARAAKRMNEMSLDTNNQRYITSQK
jgi:hypothetical protein